MGDLDQCPGLLDLGDVSQDLEALSPLNTDRDRAIRTTELSEDSAAEHEYDNISSPGGSSTCSGPTYKRHLGFGPTEPARWVDIFTLLPFYMSLFFRPLPSANVIKVEDVIVSPPSPLKHAVSQPSISSLPSRHRLSSQTSLEPRPKESRKKKKKTLLSPSYDENSLEQSTQILENDKPNTKTGKFGVSRSRHKKGLFYPLLLDRRFIFLIFRTFADEDACVTPVILAATQQRQPAVPRGCVLPPAPAPGPDRSRGGHPGPRAGPHGGRGRGGRADDGDQASAGAQGHRGQHRPSLLSLQRRRGGGQPAEDPSSEAGPAQEAAPGVLQDPDAAGRGPVPGVHHDRVHPPSHSRAGRTLATE